MSELTTKNVTSLKSTGDEKNYHFDLAIPLTITRKQIDTWIKAMTQYRISVLQITGYGRVEGDGEYMDVHLATKRERAQ